MKIFADWCIKNEAKHIEASLRALLPHVDAAVCVDSGSTDGTLEIIETVRKDFPYLAPTIHVDLGPNIDMSIARNAGLRACPSTFWQHEVTWYMNPAGDEVYDASVANLRPLLESLADTQYHWVYTYWRQWGLDANGNQCIIDNQMFRPGCYRHVDGMYWDGIWNRERVIYPGLGSYFPIENDHNDPRRAQLIHFDSNIWFDHYGWSDADKSAWRHREYQRLLELEQQGICPAPTR